MHHINDMLTIKANSVLLIKINYEACHNEIAPFPKVNVITVNNMSKKRQVIE